MYHLYNCRGDPRFDGFGFSLILSMDVGTPQGDHHDQENTPSVYRAQFSTFRRPGRRSRHPLEKQLLILLLAHKPSSQKTNTGTRRPTAHRVESSAQISFMRPLQVPNSSRTPAGPTIALAPTTQSTEKSRNK